MTSRTTVKVALVIALAFSAPLEAAEQAPSFLNDVIPVLTRAGCNQGACHGKGAGQNGFRLSLRGYAPELDHRWITREFEGRRVDFTHPERSLLLRKPTGEASHEGGRFFDVGSRDYQVLLEWVRAGAPGPKKGELSVIKLEVSPTSKSLKIDGEVPLRVMATFGDGTQRDVTWLCRFESNDPGQILVSPSGTIKILRPGETAVRASFLTEVAVAVFTVPFNQDIPPEKYAVGEHFIDRAVFAKLKELRIEPAPLSSDSEFLRRVYLDTIGTLPTVDEAKKFLADRTPNKRTKLIDALLERSEFADYWTMIVCDLLQNRKERDHDVRGVKGVRAFHSWVRREIAANRPWDEFTRSVLTATGSTTDEPAVGYFIVTVGEQRETERSEVVGSVAQAFLGTRIGCAQCHNHPLERYTQDDYYRFSAFFSRIRLDRKDPKVGPTMLKVGHRDNQNNAPIGVRQPRTGEFLKPQPLDRSEIAISNNDDPRVALVKWMTDPKNESFRGAMVNRIWKHYFGVGLVDPVDDLRATNPPSNPELWKSLTHEFVEKKFDLKHLMRVILNSRTYQLSSTTNPNNKTDSRWYSHRYARRLSAEVLLDAFSSVTGVPEQFPGYPLGTRAIQIPDPVLPAPFLQIFGRSPRVSACDCERTEDVTLAQVLHLLNGPSISEKVSSPNGKLAKMLKEIKDDDRMLDELFLATLTRLPKDSDRKQVKDYQEMEANRSFTRARIFEDVLWALLNTKEFLFNH